MDNQDDKIQRGDKEDLPESRASEVQHLIDEVKKDIKHWKYAFTRMKKWRRFARGYQWPKTEKQDLSNPDRLYVANITMRHVKQRTSALYAKNPRFRWRKSKKMLSQFWDGTHEQLQTAQETLTPKPAQQVEGEDGMVVTIAPPPPPDETQIATAQLIVQDAMQSRMESEKNRKLGKTLSILYEYQIRQQLHATKKMMKRMVASSLTSGVGYIKQTFQRATELSPDGKNAINDAANKLATIQQLAEDMEDGEFHEHDKEAEELRQLINSIEQDQQIILREGIALDYPNAMNIIPDCELEFLPGFVGCTRVTEQYCLSTAQVKKIYGVDVSSSHETYVLNDDEGTDVPKRETTRVWEIWNRDTGMCCTVCDGYNDYLVEPHAPITYTERFFPWFAFAPNAMDDEEDPFPPSDVELMLSQQMEINRAGEGLRDHRYAARPGHVAARNIGEDDANKLKRRASHDVTPLVSLNTGERIQDILQPFPTNNIDPNLYNTQPAFQDVLRSVGSQEANIGGTSGATATESSIAESSRQGVLGSATDELDDLLTEMSGAGGEILLLNMSEQQVKEIVGPGAVWANLSKEQVSKDIVLEAEAGSSGMQNQAMEVQIMERLAPLLFQLPNIDQEWLVRKVLAALDDRMDYEDAIEMGALSIMALNGQLQGQANRGASPMDQGPQGASNAPQAQMPQQTGMPSAPLGVTEGNL